MRTLILLLLCVPGSACFPVLGFAQAGQNSIVGGNGGTTTLIEGDNETGRDVSNNWWGAAGAPASAIIPNFNFASSSTFTLTGPPSVPTFECGSLNDVILRKANMKPQSETYDSSSCQTSIGNAVSLVQEGYLDWAYDTTENYLMHCYMQVGAVGAFGIFDDAAHDTCLTAQGKAASKAFLLSVLPLRTDDDWFCQCVWSFGVCFALDTNQDREDMSLLKWIADNPRCSAIASQALADYYQERNYDKVGWEDTFHYPETYDSSLLTMQQMGLDSVLIISATEGVSPEAIGSQILLSASITENPFENSTSILLSIGREAYVTIQVFDILGHQIEGAGYASVFEQGNVTIPINMTNAPPGTYLVRISTANNETQTLKLTKE